MGVGRIENFNEQKGQVKILTGKTHSGGVEVIGGEGKGFAKPVEVTLHEEVIIEGQDSIRLKKDGTPDLRFRNAPNKANWDRIKRLDWEEK